MQSGGSGSTALPGGPWGRGAAAAPCTLPGAGAFPSHIPPLQGCGLRLDVRPVGRVIACDCCRSLHTGAVLRAAGPGSRHRSFAFHLTRSLQVFKEQLASIRVHAGCKRRKGGKPARGFVGWKVLKMKEPTKKKKKSRKAEKLVHGDEVRMDAGGSEPGQLLLPGAGRWDTGVGMPFPNPTLSTGSAVPGPAGGRQSCGFVRMQPSDLCSPSDG